jgi:hypothetical protein
MEGGGGGDCRYGLNGHGMEDGRASPAPLWGFCQNLGGRNLSWASVIQPIQNVPGLTKVQDVGGPWTLEDGGGRRGGVAGVGNRILALGYPSETAPLLRPAVLPYE